jgi:hypothetical protein
MWNLFSSLKNRWYLLAGILALVYGISALLPQSVFEVVTDEDGPFENLSAAFFLIAAIAFILLFANVKFFKHPEDQTIYSRRYQRIFFLLLGLVFFFGFGEEISWGQRIFGFATPESMVNHNVQEEFNIHNLEIFNIKNKEGIRKEGLEKLLTMKQMFLVAFFLYLFVLPLTVRYSETIKRLLQRFYLPVPPLWIGAFFVGNYVFYRMLRLIMPWDFQWGLTEIQEFNFSLILMLLPFAWFGWPKKTVG